MADHPGTPFPHYGEEVAARRRRRRFLLFLGGFMLLVAAVPVGGWIALDRHAHRELKKSLRKIEKAGYAVDLRTLAPREVPSADNAAPLYVAACAILKDDYLRVDRSSSEGETAVLSRHTDAFDLARRARFKSYCRYDRDYGATARRREAGPAMGALAWALTRRAEAQSAAGKQEEARDTLRDLWAFARSMEAEPLGSSQAVTRELWLAALEATARCSWSSVTEHDWREWQALLPDPAAVRASTILGLRGDLAYWARDARSKHGGGSSRLLPGKRWDSIARSRLLRPFLDLGAAKGLKRDQARLARVEKSVALTPELVADWRPRPWVGFLQPSPIDAFGGPRAAALGRVLVLESALAVARAGMECERFRLVEGHYPGALTATDPMTGGPLEYGLDGSRIVSRAPRSRNLDIGSREEASLSWRLLHAAD